jgi:hypothetical protein
MVTYGHCVTPPPAHVSACLCAIDHHHRCVKGIEEGFRKEEVSSALRILRLACIRTGTPWLYLLPSFVCLVPSDAVTAISAKLKLESRNLLPGKAATAIMLMEKIAIVISLLSS